MKILVRSLIILLQLVAFKNIKAQYIEFVENKGQWNDKVKFEGKMAAGSVFLEQNGYRVLLNNNEDYKRIFDPHAHNSTTKTGAEDHGPEAGQHAENSGVGTGILHSHAYDVSFLNASPKAFIIPDKAINTFNNYFIGNDPSKWKTHCGIYQAVTYKNMYPNVDVRYYTDGDKLKYDIIVNPGGDINNIVMQFDGVDGLSLKNGNLIIKTSVGDVTELAPLSFQNNGTTRTKVDAKFVIIGNTVRFKIGNYSKSSTLVIDPALVFSTFSGSKFDNWGYTATYDGGGNFYSGGITFGDGFPSSVGAFQTSFQGGDNSEGSQSPDDIVIIKYSPNGSQRIYGTYVGGSGNESPHSLIVDNNGDLIISGRTSSSNFPSTQPVFGPGGKSDIFILKLNPDGSNLIGSRRFGGSENDGVNIRSKYTSPTGVAGGPTRRNYGDDARSEVIIDNANNIYLASCTQSSNFPVTANAFQKAFAGIQDGVLIKTNFDLSNVLISSYIGGEREDAAFVLALSPETNNILVGGGTASVDFPGASNGPAISQSNGGGECDGFVSLVSNNGGLIKSSYIGTTGNDLVYGVQYDKFGYPYVMGTTSGKWPIVNAAFSQANGKQFIGKMKKDISGWEYSTVFGKGAATPDISPTAFLVDRCENVYVSGWGGTADDGYPNSGTAGLTTTPNGLYKSTDGSDFYFFVLERNASSQLYGSFFGNKGGYGDHVDGGTSRFNREGVIYQTVCANCGKQGQFPTTPGVWSPSNQAVTSAQCNMAAVKIAFELAGVGAGVRASIEGVARDTSGCVPLTVDFTDTIATAKKYIWNFGDGSPEQTTLTPANSHTYTQIGDYRVRLIAIDSTTCNIADTSYTNIRARNDRAILSMKFNKIVPPCEALKYQFTNTSVAPPNKPFKPGDFVWDFGDGTTSTEDNPQHNYAAAGTYIVKLSLNDTIYCNAPDVIDTTLRVAPNVVARVETPPFGCAPYDAVFNNVSLAGQTFNWDFGDGTTSNLVSPVHTYTTPGTYTVTLEAIDPSTCNGRDDTTFTVLVSPKPTAIFSYSPLTPEENKGTTFTNSSLGATSYKWDFGDGEELTTTKIDTLIQHYYNRSGMYKVCLIAYNNYGCTDTTCQEVEAIVIPLVDVPNAFSPNADGVNDQVSIKGYGIEKLAWRVYNRWGTLVYMSTNQKNGWDGKYKGVLQPQDVYTYVLDVQFTDGTKYQKKGDITLLR